MHSFPILAVHERRVEQIPLKPPRIFEHLRPFQGRIYLFAQMIQFQLLFGLRVLGGVCLGSEHGVIFVVFDQHTRPIERQGIAVHVLGKQRGFAHLKIEEAQRRLLSAECSLDEPQRLRQIVNAIFAHVELIDVCRIDRQRHRPRHQAIEIDPDRLDRTDGLGRRFLIGLLVIVTFGLVGFPVLRVIPSHRRTVVRGAARLVGHWRDRRGRVPRQRYRVDSRRLQNREIELNVRSDGILVAARCEIQILSVGRPCGIRIDPAAVSQTGQFFRRQFV